MFLNIAPKNFIVKAVNRGFILLLDILISDNAYYHWGGECATLEGYLWEEHNVLIIYLPTRTTEWNLIELVWNVKLRCLGQFPPSVINSYGANAIAHLATDVLNGFSHEDIWKLYVKCFPLLN